MQTGSKIGRYEIRGKIGSGGMGEVYLAEDTELERQVALKVLAAEVAEDDNRVRRFILEAKAASALNHPNILTVYEIGRHENSRYIATELINGETLRGRLHSEPLTLRETLDVAMQVAAALNAAHEASVVHRDIKPENIGPQGQNHLRVNRPNLRSRGERRVLSQRSRAVRRWKFDGIRLVEKGSRRERPRDSIRRIRPGESGGGSEV